MTYISRFYICRYKWISGIRSNVQQWQNMQEVKWLNTHKALSWSRFSVYLRNSVLWFVQTPLLMHVRGHRAITWNNVDLSSMRHPRSLRGQWVRLFLLVLTLFCQLWDHHVYYVMVKWWPQISPAGFQSLEVLYLWYITIKINDIWIWIWNLMCHCPLPFDPWLIRAKK